MRIAVVDGQGGGIGRALVEKIKGLLGDRVSVIVLGTNGVATSLMMKGGADEGASGENALCVNVSKVDIIVGSIGMISADAMMGELTPKMAKAISQSPAKKLLIPLNRCNLFVTGTRGIPMGQHMDEILEMIEAELQEEQ